ncbi:MAG: putative cyclase [Bacilli bacterium]|nr:putative cyclase [Bacilli bacterium]
MSIKDLGKMLNQFEVIDLTHVLEEDMPVYPTHSRYAHTLWDSFETGSPALVYQLLINEHCGTHMDATAHFLKQDHPEHRWMAEISTDKFHSRALTMDFSHYGDTDLVSKAEIEAWERENLQIEPNDTVLLHFGWDRHWTPRSVGHAYTKSWPGVSEAAAVYLAEKRIKAIGCDTLAIDSSYSTTNPAHYVLLGNGIVIIENLTNLGKISGESYLFAFPLKIKEGSGSPIRAIAFK